jgi:dipeptidyl-peptidase-4
MSAAFLAEVILMKRILSSLAFGLVCLACTYPGARAQSLPLSSSLLQPPAGNKDTPRKKLTLDQLEKKGLGGFGAAAPTWLDDEYFVQGKGKKAVKVAALTGKSEPYKAADSPLPKLMGAELLTLSPDGKRAAFVRNNNLFVYDLATKSERQLTKDGGGFLSNGKADWVYFEELFHHSYRAFWWSPDASQLAFLQFDDSKVGKYTLINPTQRVQALQSATYPKAGGTNPTVKLGIASVHGDTLHWADLSDLAPADEPLLVIRVGWLPDSKRAYFYVQDRVQTRLDVCTIGPEGGKPTRLLRETTKAWVDDPGPLTFLKDGSFLLLSERTGYKHLYHYHADGKLKQVVTSGPWDLRKLHRLDESEGWLSFSGTQHGWLGSNLYRVRLDGRDLQRLTKEDGTHTISYSPNGKHFLDAWSTHHTPPRISLYQADGSLVRVVEASAGNKLKDTYELGQEDLVEIPMPDGFILPARVLLPPNVAANKRYPVWFQTYGGPHMPTLRDSWSGGGLRDQVLATMGFIVFRFDPRSASGRGAASTWTAYRQLGVQELKDIEAALTWLTKRYPVDPARIGMSGHSYGGYLTAYALTHSKLFAAGIASSPVTSWHNYDSIYTERYMGTPKDNPKGYEASSVVKAAKDLHGKLLIVHGMMDDNVHVQNAMELIDALQKADRDFEVMIYPLAQHGLGGKHYQRLQLDFMKRMLQP